MNNTSNMHRRMDRLEKSERTGINIVVLNDDTLDPGTTHQTGISAAYTLAIDLRSKP
jgi:hypothetical protein